MICACQHWQSAFRLLQDMVKQCVLVPRKIRELELEFEIPTWNSHWHFEEITVKSTVKSTVRSTSNFIINDIT